MSYNEECCEIRYLISKLVAASTCSQMKGVAYKFAQASQCWEKSWRRFSLLVYAIKHQHKLLLTPQYTLKVGH